MTDNKLLSLSEIFTEKFFRIPDFQRGYSWGISQLSDYWDDLVNLKENRVHYTGLLTVKPISKNEVESIEKWQDDLWLFSKNFKAYYLIDGQQRLTTSIILINEILNVIPDGEDIDFSEKNDLIKKYLYQTYKGEYKSYIFGYEKDNPSDEYFKTKILKQESSSADKYPDQTFYTENLENARSFFEDKLICLRNESIKEIFKKLTTCFKFNFYEIDDELDIYITFETMNNRGKALSNLELLKNRMIYLATMLDDNEQINRLKKDINEVWKTIYENLGKNKHRNLTDDNFLRDHWIMYFKYDRSESESYAKYLLNNHFIVKNILENKIGFNEIKSYIDSLQKSVKFWFYLYNPGSSNYSDETKEWIYKMNRLRMGAFTPLLMAVMNKCNESELLDVLKVSERFIFLVFLISQRRSNTANSKIYRYANELYHGSLELEDVVNGISYLTDGGYEDDNEYIYSGWSSIENFVNHINELYSRDEGFYGWNGLRYFLYEYELYLQQCAKGDKKISWDEFNKHPKDETIEHIYPQTANDQYWINNIKLKIGKSKKNNIKLLHSLGNLVLLSRAKNSELQNYDFEYKKKHIGENGSETGFFNGSFSEIEVNNFADWTPESIRTRGKKMLKFMDERWSIDFSSWNVDEEHILGLDFLNSK